MPSSPPSTKPPAEPPRNPRGTAAQGDGRWRVEFHPKVAKTIAKHGGVGSTVFRPSIGDLVDALETNPKQHPKKQGKLRDARAADVKYADGIVWRAVFTLDEETRTVHVVALGPHDEAYDDAERRI